MIDQNRIVKDFHLFADGHSYLGLVQDVEPPKIAMKTEEVINGGMIAPAEVPMHLNVLNLGFTMNEYNAGMLSHVANSSADGVLLRLRLAVENCQFNSAQPVEHVMRGTMKEFDGSAAISVGKKSELKYQWSLSYYKLIVNNVDIFEIDVRTYMFKVRGVDIYAARKLALALGR